MAAQAVLRGLTPPPIETARVLELGCGDGGNLVPMALGLPRATFLGIDRNEAALARGRALAAALELSNVEFRAGELETLAGPGAFDYVVAHGVYSWVSPLARDRLLAIAQGALTPDGLVYLSYNTTPGGHLHRLARELMQFAARDASDAREIVARARRGLKLVAGAQRAGDPYGAFLEEYLSRVLERGDPGLFHDELETWNEPVSVTELIDHCARHGLRFLAEADLHESSLGTLSPEIADALDELEPDTEIEGEQALDLLRLRGYRQTLFTGSRAAWPAVPDPDHVGELYAYARLGPGDPAAVLHDGSPVAFEDGRGARLSTDHPAVKGGLAKLAGAWPGALRVVGLTDTTEDAGALAQALLGAHAAGLVQLTTHDPRIAADPGARPRASPLARVQVSAGANAVTNLKHEEVPLPDAVDRALIVLLDGSRDRSALRVAAPGGSEVAGPLSARLPRLAHLGLLTA